MRSKLVRATRAAAAATTAAVALAGCHFLRPPASATASPKAAVPHPVETAADRVLDAPPILVQCAVDRHVLTPQGQGSWFSNGRITINSANAQDFAAWWHAFLTPGPYPNQTFLIDGHRTHYLAFGAHWTLKNGKWEPLHRAVNDPRAQATSLYYWSQWTAAHDALPAAVCGPNADIHKLQREIFGSRAIDPWG